MSETRLDLLNSSPLRRELCDDRDGKGGTYTLNLRTIDWKAVGFQVGKLITSTPAGTQLGFLSEAEVEERFDESSARIFVRS